MIKKLCSCVPGTGACNECAKFELSFEFVFNNLRGHRKNLEGKILTIIDASISDHEQRKAMKDLVRKSIWEEDGWLKSLLNVAEGKNPWDDNAIDADKIEEELKS